MEGNQGIRESTLRREKEEKEGLERRENAGSVPSAHMSAHSLYSSRGSVPNGFPGNPDTHIQHK